jgi:hypothetical protein
VVTLHIILNFVYLFYGVIVRKSVCLLLIFSVYGAAMADKIGLSLGAYAEKSDLLDEEVKDYFFTPQVEYGRSFGNFDLYLDGEYTFNLTRPFPQFFFAEEKIAAHLNVGARSEFQVTLHNENNLLINPEGGNPRGGGKVKPEVGYGLFLLPGDISLALGAPFTYAAGGEDKVFGIDITAVYTTPFWLGFSAAANFTVNPDTDFTGMEFAVNYEQDQFYAEIVFKAKESFDYFSLTPEFDYFFNFFTFWAAVEFGGLGRALTISPSLGAKYRF